MQGFEMKEHMGVSVGVEDDAPPDLNDAVSEGRFDEAERGGTEARYSLSEGFDELRRGLGDLSGAARLASVDSQVEARAFTLEEEWLTDAERRTTAPVSECLSRGRFPTAEHEIVRVFTDDSHGQIDGVRRSPRIKASSAVGVGNRWEEASF